MYYVVYALIEDELYDWHAFMVTYYKNTGVMFSFVPCKTPDTDVLRVRILR